MEQKKPQESEWKENVAALSIFTVLLLVVVGFFTNWYGLVEQKVEVQRVNVPIESDQILGNLSAPVTIIIFSDFECPFCKVAEGTVRQIKAKYGDDVTLVFKHFPLTAIHPNAYGAALSSECAHEQGKFWEYHDMLFGAQSFNNESFYKFANDLNLNATMFNECLSSKRYAFNVEKDLRVGMSVGVSGTPAFFINGIPLVGAQPFAEFTKVIDEELTK